MYLAGSLSIVAFGAIVAVLSTRASGRLGYPLDDAYIHLRVSEMIHAGHYGLEPSASSAPSSSILWPLLLAPFAGFSWQVQVPLYLNLACLGASATIAAAILRRCWTDERWQRWAVPVAVALCIVANTIGTALTGMEHSLQTLAVLTMGLGIAEGLRGDTLRWWFWLAVVLAPMVRYESALVSGVGLLVAWYVGDRRRAIAAGAAIAAGWAAFGGFLMSLGLDPLPSSILVKSSAGLDNLTRHGGVVPLLGGAAVLATVVLHRRGERVAALGTGLVALVFAGHMLGASTDEIRYATSINALALVMLAAALPVLLPADPVRRFTVIAVAALVIAIPTVRSVEAISHAPVATEQIAQQQCRLHEFVVDHLREPVAANDIGCISYRNSHDVLDLWGLASQEARRARLARAPGWLERLVDRHGVGIVMIYTDWFDDDVPTSWTLVGTLTSEAPGYAAHGTVDLYGTDDNAVDRLRAALAAFDREDHPGTDVRLTDPTA